MRASYGNTDFVKLNERIRHLSAANLYKNKSIWHRKCYANISNKDHTERDKNRYATVRAEGTSSVVKVKVGCPPKTSKLINEEGPASSMSSAYMTRSHNQPLGYHKNKCFFCQNERQGELHACSTYNSGIQMSEIVANCDNPQ